MPWIGQPLPPPHRDEPRRSAGEWERFWRAPEFAPPGSFKLRPGMDPRQLDLVGDPSSSGLLDLE